MKDILKIIENKQDVMPPKEITSKEIDNAERDLDVCFSDEYRACLSKYGTLTISDHELTGISKSKRLDVVHVTREEREVNSNIPDTWYVIEQTNIDGIVIWQGEDGLIYQSVPGLKPKRIYKSLADYIEEEIK